MTSLGTSPRYAHPLLQASLRLLPGTVEGSKRGLPGLEPGSHLLLRGLQRESEGTHMACVCAHSLPECYPSFIWTSGGSDPAEMGRLALGAP